MNNVPRNPGGGKPPGTNGQEGLTAVLVVIGLVIGGGILIAQLQTKQNRSSKGEMEFYESSSPVVPTARNGDIVNIRAAPGVATDRPHE